MKVLLVSTYELGHQPLAVAGPAGRLRARGHDVRCLDLSVDMWDPALGSWADKVALSVPMHTAARLAREVAPTIDGPVACYGLYAAMCADVATALVSRDPETELLRWIEADPTLTSRSRPGPAGARPAPPARTVRAASCRRARSTWSHRSRPHAVARTAADTARSLSSTTDESRSTRWTRSSRTSHSRSRCGARHVTYGDPDFFNGVHHALRVVRAVHERFPDLTFDCTVKVEHILAHAGRVGGARGLRLHLRRVRVRVGQRRDARAARQGPHRGRSGASGRAPQRATASRSVRHGCRSRPWATLDDVRAILEFVADARARRQRGPGAVHDPPARPGGLAAARATSTTSGPWDPARLTYPWTSPLDPLQTRFAALVEGCR